MSIFVRKMEGYILFSARDPKFVLRNIWTAPNHVVQVISMLILSNLLETSWCADAWEFERLSPVGSFEERPQKVSPLPVFAPFSFLSFCSWSQDITAFVTSSDDLCLIILSSLQPRPFLPLAATEGHNKEKERDLHHSQGAPQQVLLHLGHQLVILVSVSAKCSTKVIGRSWKKILVLCEYSSSRSPVQRTHLVRGFLTDLK